MKSWVRTVSGLPFGCHSSPLIWKSPTSSFFLASTEIYRLAPGLKLTSFAVDVPELSVSVRMRGAFAGLAQSLKAIAELVQQFADLLTADLMAHLTQLLRQLPNALCRPTQKRLRVAASFRCDEQFEIIGEGPIDVRELLSTGPWSSDPLQLRRLLRWLECHPLELSNADANPLAQHARCRSDRRKASSSDCLRLGGEPKTCLALVHDRRQQRKLLRDLLHPRTVSQRHGSVVQSYRFHRVSSLSGSIIFGRRLTP